MWDIMLNEMWIGMAAICKPFPGDEPLKHKYSLCIGMLIHEPEYVLPVIATRCLWICLTWPLSWFRENGYPNWTRVSTVSSTRPNAATAPTAAAAMTQTKQMEDEARMNSVYRVQKKKLQTSQVSHHQHLPLKSF